jgi:transmembrane sensor
MSEDNDRPAESARQAAIEWWVSQKAGVTPEEQATFEAWLAADPAHAAAFADIAQTFEHIKRVRRLRPAKRPAFASRRTRLAAAAVLAAACLAFYVSFDGLSTLLRADYSTGTGETKSLTLADSSHIALDASSAIAVDFDTRQRHVTLLEGQGWFEAAPDSSRPFVVEAAEGFVTALGTAFAVELINGGVRVSVAEHQVKVASGGENVIVPENEQTAYDKNSPPARPLPAGPSSIAAFRRGKLIVEDRPLGEVLFALGRYRHGFVYCVPAAVCARPVTGVFSTDKPLQALHEIEAFLGLHAVHVTDYLILFYE